MYQNVTTNELQAEFDKLKKLSDKWSEFKKEVFHKQIKALIIIFCINFGIFLVGLTFMIIGFINQDMLFTGLYILLGAFGLIFANLFISAVVLIVVFSSKKKKYSSELTTLIDSLKYSQNKSIYVNNFNLIFNTRKNSLFSFNSIHNDTNRRLLEEIELTQSIINQKITRYPNYVPKYN